MYTHLFTYANCKQVVILYSTAHKTLELFSERRKCELKSVDPKMGPSAKKYELQH